MTNWYLKFIYCEDEERRLEAMHHFLVEEAGKLEKKLDEIPIDEASPAESEEYAYLKGRLDMNLFLMGMVLQTRINAGYMAIRNQKVVGDE